MTPDQEIEFLKKENDELFMQLKETNELLFEKEEQLALLSSHREGIGELQSKIAGQLDSMQQMQNIIEKKQHQAESAEEREIALQKELIEAYGFKEKYDELLTELVYAQTQLLEAEAILKEVKKRNELLEQLAARAAELESVLENINIETEALRDTINMLKSNNDAINE